MRMFYIQIKLGGFLSILTFLLMLLFEMTDIQAQPAEFSWAERAGGSLADHAKSIATDGSGNAFVAGYFQGSANFGSITLTSAGGNDIFIAKYDGSGNIVWAQSAGGSGEDYGRYIETDGAGNAVITGYFYGSATFGSITLTSAGSSDIFIAKYDGSGNLLWAKRAGGTGADAGYGIDADGAGNCIVTGYFSSTANFGPINLTSSGLTDVFIARYDASGNVQWAKQAGGTNNDYGYGVIIAESGTNLITGYFYGSATFGATTLNSAGSSDIFIAKYDASGNVLWAKRAGGTGSDYGYSVTREASGNGIITGSFQGSATFGPITLTSVGSNDIFVAKYDGAGNVQWARADGGANFDNGLGIATDGSDNICVTGYFSGSATFGTKTLTSDGSEDIFIVKYDALGNVAWATRAGGSQADRGYGVATDGSNDIIVTGDFYGTATFGMYSMASAGSSDVFTTKLMELPSWITVTYPNGGEILYVGSSYTITWQTDKYVGLVEVALSKDGGANWINLTVPSYAPNTGSYNYVPIPDHVSSNCLIQVTSIEKATVKDQSNQAFSIVQQPALRQYIAVLLPSGVSVPTIDGDFSDPAWSYANSPEILDRGGIPDNFLAPWTNFYDNKVTWKAVWSAATNLLYIAITIQDDIAGANDHDVENLWQDDTIELFTDGNNNGGIYTGTYHEAQQWLIRRDNIKYLNYTSGQYTGPAITSVLGYGGGGNWNLEAAITIYNYYPSNVRPLAVNDVIGWDIWYDDSDNEHLEGGKWARDHQVGWGYSGPAYINADYCHDLKLGPAPTIYLPDISVTPNSWDYGSIPVFSYSDKTFIIKNDGNANLNITATTITGANASEFSIQSGGGSFTLSPGATRNVIVRFGPTSGGAKNATLMINSNDPDENPVLVNLTGYGTAVGPQWKVPLTINGAGITISRTFGGDPSATTGYDASFDIAAAPPGMTYYAYFELNVFPNYLDTDIRSWLSPYQTDIDWSLKIVNATGITSNLSWNPAALPTVGYFFLVGSGLNVNMRNQSSAQVVGSASLTIQYRYETEVTFIFSQAGWYLISLPVMPVNNNLNLLFPTAIAAFAYNSATGSYYSVTSLEPKKGYWLLIPAATAATIRGTPVTVSTGHYHIGWHLIGTVKGIVDITNPNDSPDGSVIGIYGYNPATSQYYNIYPLGDKTLKEKEGYWLAVINNCDLTIGTSALASTIISSSENKVTFSRPLDSRPPAPPFIADASIASLFPTNKLISNNYPNPFNVETVIEFTLPEPGLTQVYIYNALGQRIRTLLEEEQPAGTHQIIWDGRNHDDELVSNGIYFYRIINSGLIETKKILLLK